MSLYTPYLILCFMLTVILPNIGITNCTHNTFIPSMWLLCDNVLWYHVILYKDCTYIFIMLECIYIYKSAIKQHVMLCYVGQETSDFHGNHRLILAYCLLVWQCSCKSQTEWTATIRLSVSNSNPLYCIVSYQNDESIWTFCNIIYCTNTGYILPH